MLAWKKELKAVMDNPDYIEWQMRDIKENLKRQHPDTHLLRESIRHMNEWTHEIDLAHNRAKLQGVV